MAFWISGKWLVLLDDIIFTSRLHPSSGKPKCLFEIKFFEIVSFPVGAGRDEREIEREL